MARPGSRKEVVERRWMGLSPLVRRREGCVMFISLLYKLFGITVITCNDGHWCIRLVLF